MNPNDYETPQGTEEREAAERMRSQQAAEGAAGAAPAAAQEQLPDGAQTDGQTDGRTGRQAFERRSFVLGSLWSA
jgi:hypothetical protein